MKRSKHLVKRTNFIFILFAYVGLRLSLPPVQAQTSPPRTFVTKHTGTFNGQRINYVATVGETILKDEPGTATASLFSTRRIARME